MGKKSRKAGADFFDQYLPPKASPRKSYKKRPPCKIHSRPNAIKQAVMDRIGLDEETAGELTLTLLNYFGYNERIIDNLLTPDDRWIFYFLQDFGILTTDTEEIKLYNNKNWIIYYWELNINNDGKLMSIPMTDRLQKLYSSLPSHIWKRR